MFNTPLCINCVCLPMCLSKTHCKTMRECSFVKNTLKNISASVPVDDEIDIHFYALEKTYRVKKLIDGNILIRKMTEDGKYKNFGDVYDFTTVRISI